MKNSFLPVQRYTGNSVLTEGLATSTLLKKLSSDQIKGKDWWEAEGEGRRGVILHWVCCFSGAERENGGEMHVACVVRWLQ